MLRVLIVAAAHLAPLVACIDTVPAQTAAIPARVETPYTLMDDEKRTYIEGGGEIPLRGDGPLTGYAYLFLTRPHFLDKDLYLRLVIPPGYFMSELIRDKWPSEHSAIGVGISGGLWADSQVEFRDGRFKEEESFSGHSAGGTLAYYLRGPKIGPLPLEAQIRANPKYVWYDRTDDTSHRFRLPENTAIYDARVGVRLGGVPPELFPKAAAELSFWHAVGYRDNAGRYGLPERPEETEHFTQRTWTRLGAMYTFSGTQQVSAFLNAGIAEDSDPLSSFRLGGGLRLRAEFPLMLHGYNVEEIFARRFVLVNLAYRFPVWPDQDRVHLQLLADYARIDYLPGHHLPRNNLGGVGASLSVALTKRIMLVVGYGYGINAPRNGGFGGHSIDTQFEFKW